MTICARGLAAAQNRGALINPSRSSSAVDADAAFRPLETSMRLAGPGSGSRNGLLMSSVSYRTESPYTPHDAYRPVDTQLDRPLRILIPSYRSHPHTGGQGVYLRFLTRALVDLGHTVDVMSGPPYPDLDPRVGLIKLESLDLYAKPKVWMGFPAVPDRAWRDPIDAYEYISHISGAFAEPTTFGMRMVRYLRDHKDDYDIVHDNQTLCRGLLDIQAMGIPVIAALHHPITRDRRISIAAANTISLRLLVRRWYSFLGKQIKVARQLDPVIVVSESTRRDVARDFGIAPERLDLVYHGVDSELFRPLPDVPRHPRRLITTASADVPLKGLIYLVEAYHQLLQTYPDLELMVVGKLREGATAQRLDALGIRDRVQFVSDLTFEDIVKLYAEAAIAVCPSVYEGFGFPAAEAMACGLPLVSTSGGSLPEVVGEAGLVVPPKDPGALVDAISTLLDDDDLRNRLGQDGRERVLRHFPWEKTARKVSQIYYRLLSSPEWSAHANRRSQIPAA